MNLTKNSSTSIIRAGLSLNFLVGGVTSTGFFVTASFTSFLSSVASFVGSSDLVVVPLLSCSGFFSWSLFSVSSVFLSSFSSLGFSSEGSSTFGLASSFSVLGSTISSFFSFSVSEDLFFSASAFSCCSLATFSMASFNWDLVGGALPTNFIKDSRGTSNAFSSSTSDSSSRVPILVAKIN